MGKNREKPQEVTRTEAAEAPVSKESPLKEAPEIEKTLSEQRYTE